MILSKIRQYTLFMQLVTFTWQSSISEIYVTQRFHSFSFLCSLYVMSKVQWILEPPEHYNFIPDFASQFSFGGARNRNTTVYPRIFIIFIWGGGGGGERVFQHRTNGREPLSRRAKRARNLRLCHSRVVPKESLLACYIFIDTRCKQISRNFDGVTLTHNA